MHLFRLCLSFDASVASTRNSIREASRYFGTARIIFTAHLVPFFLSTASTTLPKVPWPKSFVILSVQRQPFRLQAHAKEKFHTSFCQFRIGYNYIMAIFIVNFFTIVIVFLALFSMAKVDLGMFFHSHLAQHVRRRLML